MARRETAPLDALGVARNWLAVWPVAAVTASVPELVTGEPATEYQGGMVRPTLVTAPLAVEATVTPVKPGVSVMFEPAWRYWARKVATVIPLSVPVVYMVGSSTSSTRMRSD